MRLLAGTFSLLFLFSLGCTQKPSLPHLGKKGSGNSGGIGYNSDEDDDEDDKPDPDKPVVPEPEYPTEIKLSNLKFKGEESKLEAIVKYAGSSSARLKISLTDDNAKFSIPKLASGKDDTLIVELYEGDKIRFKASRAKTQIAAGKTHSFAFEDCQIQKLPWDGETHQTLCGWTIENAKK